MTQQYLSVTALTRYIKYKFEQDPYLERVFLTGELSNFRARPNAHQYFSIKDANAKISAVMFKGAYAKLKFEPKEGMKVLVIGRITLYEATGQYQITIEHMEPDGVGALYQAFEEMKEKLSKEGLFNAPKKPLVKFPKRIAVITSPSGAVIRDIMTTVKRRYPIAELVIFPTLVQGTKAAQNIVANIQKADDIGNFDTMIVARGGGSIEDLWPFNEEIVARAIFAAKTPIISSVGHETDITIADFVADVRAATPTAAAELSVPNLTDELLKIREKEHQLMKAFRTLLRHKKERLHKSQDSYIFRQPQRLYESLEIKLDSISQRFNQQMTATIQKQEQQLSELTQRLQLVNPSQEVEQSQQQLNFLKERLMRSMILKLDKSKMELAKGMQALDMLSPLNIMKRGYGYVTDESGIIHSAQQLSEHQEITINFTDGKALAEVKSIEYIKE
ncbi:exodeoxyribonuclease VII large subunit [Vagococcus xieshaowenii]|uniref:Exodeoxyribonuclease 7 large subunit n=1 Tax=Vagococcus xieshaowenii TaxID=2562451 RepID=A0A4Z0DBP4_9ENTE|nr:exodeoxyribonuclease VII large subunit [Vagococcus xieshaowenii]QCA28285.1 exodeoxyribonuclease VII large subunit [Vagococcus xieshaowenii]TFZ42327.1 exodeoxyribonuclease VII large subunit [Vagococcus xieshaowenii]